MREKIIDLLYAENVRSDCGIERLADEICAIAPAKWIPCKDRLPEKEGHYIVTVIGFRAERFVRADYFAKGEFDLWQREAVAWAEMPEPWRGEEDEERLDATEQG